MDKIAVLIPCYNESQTIKKVILDWKKSLPEAVIYVYDNNSKDGTSEVAKAAGALVRKETRQGKGNVIRTMFRDIDADIYKLKASKVYCSTILSACCFQYGEYLIFMMVSVK